jgi:AcrR family transcriptional regulator
MNWEALFIIEHVFNPGGSMSDSQPDRRVRRTRQALQDALISLILEKGYDSVTIEEITNRADLGRTTFYLHYRDKEELLLQAIDSIVEDFIAKHAADLDRDLSPALTAKSLQANLDERILFHVFEHARENADLYKVMLRGEGSSKTTERMRVLISEEAVKRLQNRPMVGLKVPLNFFGAYFAGALIEVVTWWLENDQPYDVKSTVAYFQQLFIFGAMDAIQIGPQKRQA